MNKLLLLLSLIMVFACKKNHKTADSESQSDTDLDEIINSDDYFKIPSKGKSSLSDSSHIKVIPVDDLNNDGLSDTVFITFNPEKQIFFIHASCFPGQIKLDHTNGIQVKDIKDLNGDGKHELLVFLESEESCWDQIVLYSFLDVWVEKYKGLTYQCSENNSYRFSQVDDHTVQLITYGTNKDSFDVELGDSVENVLPNAENVQLIKW